METSISSTFWWAFALWLAVLHVQEDYEHNARPQLLHSVWSAGHSWPLVQELVTCSTAIAVSRSCDKYRTVRRGLCTSSCHDTAHHPSDRTGCHLPATYSCACFVDLSLAGQCRPCSLTCRPVTGAQHTAQHMSTWSLSTCRLYNSCNCHSY